MKIKSVRVNRFTCKLTDFLDYLVLHNVLEDSNIVDGSDHKHETSTTE